jgi:hypothetical protein
MRLIASFMLVTAVACTEAPSGPFEIRFGATDQVSGSSFRCDGTWPSDWTPCSGPSPSVPWTRVDAPNPGTIRIRLGTKTIPTDGGASAVLITIDLDDAGHVIGGAAEETSTRGGFIGPPEVSGATGGWVDPVVVSADPTARQAGAFAIYFAWGSIQGTYDSAN